jgi:hypothetical protein
MPYRIYANCSFIAVALIVTLSPGKEIKTQEKPGKAFL